MLARLAVNAVSDRFARLSSSANTLQCDADLGRLSPKLWQYLYENVWNIHPSMWKGGIEASKVLRLRPTEPMITRPQVPERRRTT